MILYINNDPEPYNFFTSYPDTWLLDYDYRQCLIYNFSSEIDTETLVEIFCSHVNYWLNSDDYEKNSSNDVIKNSILKMGPLGNGTPELLFYDFNGKSVYDEQTKSEENHGFKHEFNDLKTEISLFYDSGEKLVCSLDDFKNILWGSIEEYEADPDNEIYEDVIEVDFSPTPLFFMKIEDQIEMRKYIFDFFNKINEYLIDKIEIV